MIDATTPVVFDINVYLDYILGADGSWPLLPDVPPTTDNPAADAVALAFAAKFRLYCSPHILRNIARVMRATHQSESVIERYLAAIADICTFSGGGTVEPAVRDHGIADHEDNAIASLAKDAAVDALIVVSSDRDLLTLGPNWHGRLVMHPRDFVRRVVA